MVKTKTDTKAKGRSGTLVITSSYRNRKSLYYDLRNIKLQIRYNNTTDPESSTEPKQAAAAAVVNTPIIQISPRTKKTRNLLLTPKRKLMIKEFKLISHQDSGTYGVLGTNIWIQNLHEFMMEKDTSVSLEDVKRWFAVHAWIRDKLEMVPAKPTGPAVTEIPVSKSNVENGNGNAEQEKPSGSGGNKPLDPKTSTPNRRSPSSLDSSFPTDADSAEVLSAFSNKICYFFNTLNATVNKSKSSLDKSSGETSNTSATSENCSDVSFSIKGKFKNVKANTPEISHQYQQNSISSAGNTPAPAGFKRNDRRVLGDLTNISGINIDIEPNSTNDSNSYSNSSQDTETDGSGSNSQIELSELSKFIHSIHSLLQNDHQNQDSQSQSVENVASSSNGSTSRSSLTGGSISSPEKNTISSLKNIMEIIMKGNLNVGQAGGNPYHDMMIQNFRDIFKIFKSNLRAGRNSEFDLSEIYKYLDL